MDTELLKTFLEVSRTRHFGRAAESLYLTQSAVSFRIRQLENQLATFRVEGGFTEALTAERLAHRTEKSRQADAPLCPICGKPMIKRMAKKGINSGKEFWSCSNYPECNGTRKIQ